MNSHTHPAPVEGMVDCAVTRLNDDLKRSLPLSWPHVEAWINDITGGAGLCRYFLHASAFPSLLLPWWLEETLTTRPDRRLHTDLIGSSIRGYLGIRLIDDVMDADPRAQVSLLPVTAFFFSGFQSLLARWFPTDPLFWTAFHKHWARAADSASDDATAAMIDQARFRQVAAAKVRGALIPMTAVCRLHELTDVPEPWQLWFQSLAEWHQLRNDVRDWQRDKARGVPTIVLSDAQRDKHPGQDVTEWMLREGALRQHTALAERLEGLRDQADVLGSPGARSYLEDRTTEQERTLAAVKSGTREINRLYAIHGTALRQVES
ncbi:hypothetical protein K4749_40420 [Streptomyces sp. TRM72054]|uniref:hypothetical protein n=1 Tax=Streptomyces sp. TRM72054 TaxID=2870562 RepID=UPI001C8CE649|nr:hypothetical protein [Streptomyces sp. TRM72054]MBX9399607.1 hypothetical protein [Streptomyces sp. TRM72054]